MEEKKEKEVAKLDLHHFVQDAFEIHLEMCLLDINHESVDLGPMCNRV